MAGKKAGIGDGAPMIDVFLPSGGTHEIYEVEKDDFERRHTAYLKDNAFDNVSDYNDLDRLLIFEQLVYRWGKWLSTGVNFNGEPVRERDLQDQMVKVSKEITAIKEKLVIDKSSRNKEKGMDDVGDWIENLLFRAKRFGFKRNEEFAEIMEIFNELRGIIFLYHNSDETERKEYQFKIGGGKNAIVGVNTKLGLTPEHIIEWYETEAQVRIDEIDRKFRQDTPDDVEGKELKAVEGGQRMWID